MTKAELKDLAGSMSDETWALLVEHRGGCSCHYDPPCGAHSDPLTEEEVIELGLLDAGAIEDTDDVMEPRKE